MSQHINPTPKQTDLTALNSKMARYTATDPNVLYARQNGDPSATNWAMIKGDGEGGNVRINKGLCHAELDTNTMSSDVNSGYVRFYLNDGTSAEITKAFKFNQNGTFTDGNGVNTKTLNDFRLIRAGDNGVCSNALLINGVIDHPYNWPMRINSTTTNKPSDCSFGVREVVTQNTNDGSLYCIIYGVDTSNNLAIWMNFLSNTWSGWKKCSFT